MGPIHWTGRVKGPAYCCVQRVGKEAGLTETDWWRVGIDNGRGASVDQ